MRRGLCATQPSLPLPSGGVRSALPFPDANLPAGGGVMRKMHLRPTGRRAPLPEPSITSHILVATRGSDGVSPEIRVARSLVERHRSMVDVVSVVSPRMPPPLITDVGLEKPAAPAEPLAPE